MGTAEHAQWPPEPVAPLHTGCTGGDGPVQEAYDKTASGCAANHVQGVDVRWRRETKVRGGLSEMVSRKGKS